MTTTANKIKWMAGIKLKEYIDRSVFRFSQYTADYSIINHNEIDNEFWYFIHCHCGTAARSIRYGLSVTDRGNLLQAVVVLVLLYLFILISQAIIMTMFKEIMTCVFTNYKRLGPAP